MKPVTTCTKRSSQSANSVLGKIPANGKELQRVSASSRLILMGLKYLLLIMISVVFAFSDPYAESPGVSQVAFIFFFEQISDLRCGICFV